jgi:hypothetical protein
VRAASDGREIDRAKEAWIDKRSNDKIRISHTEFRKETETEASLDHALNPIVARRAEHLAHKNAATVQFFSNGLEDFAI